MSQLPATPKPDAQSSGDRELFRFHSDALPDEKIYVVRFSGTEALNELFDFTIQLVSPNLSLDCSALLSDVAHFTLVREDNTSVTFSGYPALARQEGQFGEFAYYTVSLRPTFWKMTQIVRSGIFLDKTLQQVIEEVLQSQKFFAFPFEVAFIRPKYPAPEFAMQYDETVYDYLLWRLEEQGAYYYFTEKDGQDSICFADAPACHTSIHGSKLRYAPVSGLDFPRKDEIVTSFAMTEVPLPRRVVIRTSSWKNPLRPVVGMADVHEQGVGDVYLANEEVESEQEANRLAKIRAEALLASRRRYNGVSTVPELRPGFTFTLEKHFNQQLNQEYLVTSVTHEGSQESFLSLGLGIPMHEVQDHLFYRNTFTCIESATPYRPVHKARRAKISGVLNAFVDGGGAGLRPEMDEFGRYRLIFPFDVSGRDKGRASCWIRMSSPNAGQLAGVNFPLLPGTEVLVSFFNGNPNLPFITGALANAEVSPLSTNETADYSGINTAGGNRLVFSNQAKKQGFSLQTAHGSGLHMSAGSVEYAKLESPIMGSNNIISSVSSSVTNTVASSKATLTADSDLPQVIFGAATAIMGGVAPAISDSFPKTSVALSSVNKYVTLLQAAYEAYLGPNSLRTMTKTPYFAAIRAGGRSNSVQVQTPYTVFSMLGEMLAFSVPLISQTKNMFIDEKKDPFAEEGEESAERKRKEDERLGELENTLQARLVAKQKDLDEAKTKLENKQKDPKEVDTPDDDELKDLKDALKEQEKKVKAAKDSIALFNDYMKSYKMKTNCATIVDPIASLMGELLALATMFCKFGHGELHNNENFGGVLVDGKTSNVNIVGKKAVSIHSHDSVLINTTAGVKEAKGAAAKVRETFVPPATEAGEAPSGLRGKITPVSLLPDSALDWTAWGGPLAPGQRTAFSSPTPMGENAYKEAVTNFYNKKVTNETIPLLPARRNQFSVVTQDCYVDAENKAEFVLQKHKMLAGEHVIRSEVEMDNEQEKNDTQYAEFKTTPTMASLILHGDSNGGRYIEDTQLFLESQSNSEEAKKARLGLSNKGVFASTEDSDGSGTLSVRAGGLAFTTTYGNGAELLLTSKEVSLGRPDAKKPQIKIEMEDDTIELAGTTVKFANLVFSKSAFESEGGPIKIGKNGVLTIL